MSERDADADDGVDPAEEQAQASPEAAEPPEAAEQHEPPADEAEQDERHEQVDQDDAAARTDDQAGAAAAEPDERDEPAQHDHEAESGGTAGADADAEGEPSDEADDGERSEDSDESEESDEGASGEPVGAAAADADRPTRGQRRGAHARRVTPRERLRELIAPQANRTQALIAVACLILGFALSVQVRSTSQESSFSSLRQSELVGLLDRLNKRQEDLRTEVLRLQKDRAALESDDSESARQAAQDRQHTLAILAGTEPAAGPGIELVISDRDGGVSASDLLNAVQELRDAGAEVLQIGSVRIAVDSHFVDADEGMLVDGQKLKAPYRIKAIGDPHTMATAMDIPGGVLESLHRAGAEGSITESQSVAVTAVRDP